MGSLVSQDSIQTNSSKNLQISKLERFTTIIEKNGDKYVGELEDNEKHGYGILYYNNHESYIRYEGFWKKNKKYSKGTMVYKDGSTYIGHWNNDLREGEGVIYYDNGEKFCGHFKDDKKNGKGIFYSKNYNSIYLGLYKDDVKDGKGITYYKKNNKISKEIWDNGIIISCKMEKNNNFLNNNEDSLDNSQSKLLFNFPNNNIKSPLPLIRYYKASIPNNFFDIMNLVIMTYDLLYDNGEVKEWKENNIIKLFERIGIEKNKYNDIILNGQINGTIFLKLTFNDLKEYNINDVKDVKLIMKSIYFLREFYTKYFEYYMEYEKEEDSKIPINLKHSMKKPLIKKNSSNVLFRLGKQQNPLINSLPNISNKKFEEDKTETIIFKKGKSNNDEGDDSSSYNANDLELDIINDLKNDLKDIDIDKRFERKRNKSITIKTNNKNRKKEIIENVGFTLTKMSITKIFMHSLFQNGFSFFIPFHELTKGEKITENKYYQIFLGKWQGKKIFMKCLSIDKIQKDAKNNKNANKLNITDIMQTFIKEINICNNLRHPNIVLFIGVSINKNEFYQIHEYVENNTLYDLLHKEKQIKSILKLSDNNMYMNDEKKENAQIKETKTSSENNNKNDLNASINNIDINDEESEKEIIGLKINKTYDNFHSLEEVSQGKILFQIAYEISVALRYLHSRNIIHCNLKSKYILLDEEYHIKLGNFSLSKIVNFFSDYNKEEQYFLENKYEWTPPEILTNGKFEESSDIYSFGIILYELFTGEIPHKSIGDNQIIGLSNIICESKSYYRFLVKLIKKCINEDPKNRPSLENISNFLYKASKLFDKREFTFEELGNFILA